LEQGLVFISDTRTNAGVDHISVFRKLHTFGVTGNMPTLEPQTSCSQLHLALLRHE
jgi:predicted proteasome-type protease